MSARGCFNRLALNRDLVLELAEQPRCDRPDNEHDDGEDERHWQAQVGLRQPGCRERGEDHGRENRQR
ncbi:hypothetical protein SDC9_161378 [bioreactor metagenome]|uniref:Uncharacterized protein n=1 Tax=bioreactor metagenome TaxID=1076179 RepID=A0A645FKG2_9ZZZZ